MYFTWRMVQLVLEKDSRALSVYIFFSQTIILKHFWLHSHFYYQTGTIPETDIKLATKTIKLISESFVDFYFTGLYLPPGKEIRLNIHEGKNKWKVWLP